MDFSNIFINKINIKNSKNDCLDLSFGNYFVKNINANLCGDKGISVGENSNFFLEEANINNSNIGLASKDSSRTEIQKININNVVKCLSAYKKKQEFFGGYINVQKIDCKNFSKYFDVDSLSIIKSSIIDLYFQSMIKRKINIWNKSWVLDMKRKSNY